MKKRKAVIIAEGEIIIAMHLEQILTRMGYAVAGMATTGEEAVAMAKKKRPDLVISEKKMPGKLGGLKAAAMITHDLNIPVVFLSSALVDKPVQINGSPFPYECIQKPFRNSDVMSVMAHALPQ